MLGLDADLAAQPIADAPRGGVDIGFDGTFGDDSQTAANGPAVQDAGTQSFAGLGPLLEADDATAFSTLHNLVLRQERLAKNRLAIDMHWTRIRQGYPWSRLEKVENQDIWRAVLPPGTERMSSAAVPNKTADLAAKIVETLMVDPPKAQAQPINSDEIALRAAEMSERFLNLDGSEIGTNDVALFWNALDASMARASAFLHYWVDTSGGGYVPMQIKAHPAAQDPRNPMVATDPATGLQLPAVDPTLRYVATDEQGQPTQFVTDPAQAGQQWQPKICIDEWGREHIRIFPETATVSRAEKIIGLYYCTVSEAKRRWKSIAALTPDQIDELLDWTPPRYLALLPPALRARWKLANGDPNDTPGGTDDERLMFFYTYYGRPTPANIGQYKGYRKGAHLVVSGAFGGFVINRDTLVADVLMPSADANATGDVKDERCMELPVVQVTPRRDPDDRDPTGVATIALFGGAGEAAATLITAYEEAIDVILHPAKFIPSTSPVEGWQIDQSRGTGDPVPVLSKDDFPKYEDPRPIPPGFLETIQWLYNQMDSASGVNKPAVGANDQQEVSGIARSIAVRQSLVALSRAMSAALDAWTRHFRIKLQLAMKYFNAPQLIHYVGEDGSYKEEWWKGNDFALIQNVVIKSGTGTMLPPAEKQQHAAFAMQMRWISPDEAAQAVRPTFSNDLGLDNSPHEQRVQRQIAVVLKGPPKSQPGAPTWAQLWQQYSQRLQQYTAAQQQYQQQVQAYQQRVQNEAIVAAGAPNPTNGPEQQNETAAVQFQQARIALLADNGMNDRAVPPQPPQIQPPQPPPHPFSEPLPNDDEPEIAAIRKRQLSLLMSGTRFAAQPSEWRQPVYQEYQRMRQASAIGLPTQAAHQQLAAGGNPFGGRGGAGGPTGAAAGATQPQAGASPQAQSAGPKPLQNMAPQQNSPGRPAMVA